MDNVNRAQDESAGVAQQVVTAFLDELGGDSDYETTAKALEWIASTDQKPTDALLRQAIFETEVTL